MGSDKKSDALKVEDLLDARTESWSVCDLYGFLQSRMRERGEDLEDFDTKIGRKGLEDRKLAISLLADRMSISDVILALPNQEEREKRVERRFKKHALQYLEENAGHADVKEIYDFINARLESRGESPLPDPGAGADVLLHDECYEIIVKIFSLKEIKEQFPEETAEDIWNDVSNLQEQLEDIDNKSNQKAERHEFSYLTDQAVAKRLSATVKKNMNDRQKGVISNALPAVGLHDLKKLDSVQETLSKKYPHAVNVIDGILGGVRRVFRFGQSKITIRPVVLVGKPGAGKSTLAADVMKSLGIPVTRASAAGVADITFFGTSAGYSSAMPSLITTAIVNGKVINPGIVLDEVDKATQGSSNGDLVDGLLSVLEPVEARAWHEKFFQAEVDASHLNWILTANDIDCVPAPLVSRCTVYRVPEPDVAHVGALAASIVDDYAAELGVDPRFFQLSAGDLEYLRETMPKHRSVRVLRELVRLILDEHEAGCFHA
ncbi:MAG: AAA family ATPase [Roseovarius pacificus]|nr:AAA family ATPase [Roseovarius pacificus]